MDRRSFLFAAGGVGLVGAWWTESIPSPSEAQRTISDAYGGAPSADSGDQSGERSDSEDPWHETDDESGLESWFDFNAREIEAEFLDLFNRMRESKGLVTVALDHILTEMGQAHAENMAENDYVGHVQPETGRTIEDRFRERGLLPQCELPVGDGSGYYYPGAENAARAAVGRVTHPGSDEEFMVDSNAAAAEFLMDSWMRSDGHREVMVLPAVREIGLGVAIRDDGEIFAALEFC
jgi:uncharacterized protein YkwD